MRRINRKIVFKLCTGYTLIIIISMALVGIFAINSFKSYTFTSKEVVRHPLVSRFVDCYDASSKDKE